MFEVLFALLEDVLVVGQVFFEGLFGCVVLWEWFRGGEGLAGG